MRIKNLGLLACAAVVAGYGCGDSGSQGTTGSSASSTSGGSTPAAGGKKVKVGVVFDSGGKGDKSFNDSADAGAQRAKAELGAEVFTVDSKAEKDYQVNMESLAEKGCDIIFAIGFKQEGALKIVAPKYPNVKFAIVDDKLDLPNVRSLLFSEQQGSFLAGYLAGLVTKSNKIGFVGGQQVPLIKKFECGYIAGAKTANPKVDATGIKYTESWDDIPLAKSMSHVLFTGGCDIVYHAAGRCGLGVISEAKDQGKLAIGVDSNQDDQAPGNVLTSMVKRVDVALFDTIKDVQDGKFTAGTKVYDLKNGGIGLTDFKYTKDKIGDANIRKVADETKLIVDGKVTPPTTDDELKTYLTSIHAN